MKHSTLSLIAIPLVASLIFLPGCGASLGEFSFLSTKNYNSDIEYYKVGRMKGESKVPTILFYIPLTHKRAHIKDAIDDAIDQGGGVFLANAELKFKSLNFILFQSTGYEVIGDVYAPVHHSMMLDEDEERFTLIETEEGPALQSKTSGDMISVHEVTDMFNPEN
ncbi:MAG: hypothetical protein J4G05_05175 [Chlorobi bacterium]|nr:hypothetical protein [Chlorobiota bacterium]